MTSFAVLEIRRAILEARAWIEQQDDYAATLEGLKTLARKIVEVTGIKFDGRWGQGKLSELVNALDGKVRSSLHEPIEVEEPIESEIETEPEEKEYTATVKRLAGRLNTLETVFILFVPLKEISSKPDTLVKPGFYLSKSLYKLGLNIASRIHLQAKILSKGHFVRTQIYQIDRRQSDSQTQTVLRINHIDGLVST
ncbi:MAG: hypothetical protein AAFQ91_18630 [Cyanobacteria bacterium J06621_15]